MTIFKKFNEEMFLEVKKKERFSKKTYNIFISEIIENLPKELELTPIQYDNEIYNINCLLSYILDRHKGYYSFTTDEHSTISWFVISSSSVSDLENKLITKFKEESNLINLSRSLYFDNLINNYKEKYIELVNLINIINKNREITVVYDDEEKEVYYKNPSRKKLSYHFLTYDLIKTFLNEKGKYDKTYFNKIIRILDIKNDVIFEKNFK